MQLKSRVVKGVALLALMGGFFGSAAFADSAAKVNTSKVVRTVKKAEIKQKVNINMAKVVDLTKIKQISKTKAQKIIEYREQHGNFSSLDDLLKVKCRGINQGWLKKVSPFLAL